jgi:hypothetical protein
MSEDAITVILAVMALLEEHRNDVEDLKDDIHVLKIDTESLKASMRKQEQYYHQREVDLDILHARERTLLDRYHTTVQQQLREEIAKLKAEKAMVAGPTTNTASGSAITAKKLPQKVGKKSKSVNNPDIALPGYPETSMATRGVAYNQQQAASPSIAASKKRGRQLAIETIDQSEGTRRSSRAQRVKL